MFSSLERHISVHLKKEASFEKAPCENAGRKFADQRNTYVHCVHTAVAKLAATQSADLILNHFALDHFVVQLLVFVE